MQNELLNGKYFFNRSHKSFAWKIFCLNRSHKSLLMLCQMYCLTILKGLHFSQVMHMVMLPAMMEERQPMQEDMQILLLEGIA